MKKIVQKLIFGWNIFVLEMVVQNIFCAELFPDNGIIAVWYYCSVALFEGFYPCFRVKIIVHLGYDSSKYSIHNIWLPGSWIVFGCGIAINK